MHDAPRWSTGERSLGALLIAASLLCGCQRDPKPENAAPAALSADERALSARALENYAELAYAIYGDASDSANALLAEIDRFLARPSAEGMKHAREAWIAARLSYQQSEVFRFYDGPIDRVESLVNTWPIDESFVELGSAPGKPGIIEDSRAYPEISTALLEQLNMKDGETSISTGYHVVEYLLWGRDTRADGPGDRPFSDYIAEVAVPPKKGEKPAQPASEAVAVRRARYLRAATELLTQHLGRVREDWAPGNTENYRAQFLRLPPVSALGLVIKGMGTLSGPELSGERLTAPYETKDQENEHSCFSDTTTLDIVNDAVGIENVCLGRYQRERGEALQGAGICDVIAQRDAALGQQLKRELAASVSAARQIPAPFDNAMLGADDAPGRKAIRATISALQKQTETIAQVAATFDIRLSLADPRVQR